mmetsp:Transcript_102647/g.313940  ORF Transcript_102647/g.313940 Transcript_102647/m.313940 type:complete len:265 (-) Transcript_102647:598-1392(-)
MPVYARHGSARLPGWKRTTPSHCNQYSFAAVRHRTAAAWAPRQHSLYTRTASLICSCSASTSVLVPFVQAPCNKPKELASFGSSTEATRWSMLSKLTVSPVTPQQHTRPLGGLCHGGCTWGGDKLHAKVASLTWLLPSHTAQGPRASAGWPTSPRAKAHVPPATSCTAHSTRAVTHCSKQWSFLYAGRPSSKKGSNVYTPQMVLGCARVMLTSQGQCVDVFDGSSQKQKPCRTSTTSNRMSASHCAVEYNWCTKSRVLSSATKR